MSDFVDRLLVRISEPSELLALLAPADDPNHNRLRRLLAAAYDLPSSTLHGVQDVQVLKTEFERPLFPPGRTTGTWTQTTPSFARTDVAYERQGDLIATWLDIVADVGMVLVLRIDPVEVESILVRDVSGFITLEEFRSRFRFIDLDAFMAKHGLTTVEELREAFQYLLAEIRLRAATPFDPNDRANWHRYKLCVAILVRDRLDIAAALRDVKLVRTAAERALTYHREIATAEVRAPFAPLVIFPQAELVDSPFSADELQTFFELERIATLFTTPE